MNDEHTPAPVVVKKAKRKKAGKRKTTKRKAATTRNQQKETREEKPVKPRDGYGQYVSLQSKIDTDLQSGNPGVRKHAPIGSRPMRQAHVSIPPQSLTPTLRGAKSFIDAKLLEDAKDKHPAAKTYLDVANTYQEVSTDLHEKLESLKNFEHLSPAEREIESTRIKVESLKFVAKMEGKEQDAMKQIIGEDAKFINKIKDFNGEPDIDISILHFDLNAMPKGKLRKSAIDEIIRFKMHKKAGQLLQLSPQALGVKKEDKEMLLQSARFNFSPEYNQVYQNLNTIRGSLALQKKTFINTFKPTREQVKAMKQYDSQRELIFGEKQHG